MGATNNGRPLPLNDFQQLMLQWNEHQPFHVVDVVELARPLDIAKLQAAAEAELIAAGVFHPMPDSGNRNVLYKDGPVHIPIQLVMATHPEDVRRDLEAQCSAELTRRFQPGTDSLFRLWVLRSTPGDYLGMTWQHWPCDGYSAADLLRRILGRYFGIAVPETSTLTDREPADLAAAFRPFQGWRARLYRFRKTVQEILRIRRAYVAPRPADPKVPLQTHFVDLPMDVLTRIQERGERDDATVNDVIAASLMNALTSSVPAGSMWRRRVSISNIVDLRQTAPEQFARKWGLFLGFCIFDCDGLTPPRDAMVTSVRDQSRRTKANRGYFASLKAMAISRRMWYWLPAKWRWSMSRSLGSFSAVLSNLRLPLTWFPPPWNEEIRSYWRTLPLGSIVPLSMAVTTFDNRLTITMTTEQGSYFAERMETLKKSITQNLV